jgi:hypothetical protein
VAVFFQELIARSRVTALSSAGRIRNGRSGPFRKVRFDGGWCRCRDPKRLRGLEAGESSSRFDTDSAAHQRNQAGGNVRPKPVPPKRWPRTRPLG